MVTFDIKALLDKAKRNYEKAWLDGALLLEKEGQKFSLPNRPGKGHPVYNIIQEARQALIKLGFEEMVLPIFVDEDDIYKEYGSEAALILDRVFYTAELPRPDIGISEKKIKQIKNILPSFNNLDGLQELFRSYKKGEVEADDFIEEMVTRFGISASDAASIIDKVFPEFKNLQPVPSKRTLRSHTTALWFPVLGALQGRKPMPILLFHVGTKFRREQKLDATHLYESTTLSLVTCAEEITLQDCMTIAEQICRELGFIDAKFEIKTATGKYYAPGMEFEVYVKHEQGGEWLEIGDGGFYSPVSCANYGISHPVFNIGFGIERIAMIRTGEVDIRNLVYPYFYAPASFSDTELAKLIEVDHVPITPEGNALSAAIISTIEAHASDDSPCEIAVGTFRVCGTEVNVSVWEQETGVKLAGKAAFNEIHVLDGSIDCHDSLLGAAPESAASTGIRFVDAVVKDFVWGLEKQIDNDKNAEFNFHCKMVKKASDVNIRIDPVAIRYITDKQQRVNLKGPVFLNLTATPVRK